MRCVKSNIPMAIEDKKNNVYGFQFHPDSFLTVDGKFLIQKVLQF
jgi:anthranilate synthase component 2/para-aminobenzoate synthetase component 2